MCLLKIISPLYLKIDPASVLEVQFVGQSDSCVCVSTEDVPDSPSGTTSPKVALLPPVLKKVPSDKERDGQSSPQPSPRTFSQEGKKFFLWVSSPHRETFQEKGNNPGLN